MKKFSLGTRTLTLRDVHNFLSSSAEFSFEISPALLKTLSKNAGYLEACGRKHIVYGFNTGLGPMAEHIIPPADRIQLQYNLITSHAMGAGASLPEHIVRTIMLVRLATLLKGTSGIYPDAPLLLAQFLEHGITPIIPEHGSVGASGDLVQLAHIALALIGKGDVIYKGKKTTAQKAIALAKLKPLSIKTREGLALINGTAAMTGIGALVALDARRLVAISELLSAAIYEISGASREYISPEINVARGQRGQIEIAKRMRAILESSSCLEKKTGDKKDHLERGGTLPLEHVQHIYSIRCVPQVLGPILETCEETARIVEIEMNAVTDNPLTITGKGIYHGGNFHGDAVSIAMDKTKIALTKLSMLSERQLNYLMNPKLNGVLPPFMNLGVIGKTLGLQGLQFTATSTTAENQMLSNPMSVHSISTNNDNQDVVSMGTNAALMTKKVVDNTYQILAIEAVAIVRAIHHLDLTKKLSAQTRGLYMALVSKHLLATEDVLTAEDVAYVENILRTNDVLFSTEH